MRATAMATHSRNESAKNTAHIFLIVLMVI